MTRRFVDPADLIWGGCGEQERPEPPRDRVVTDGARPDFSHLDATTLCQPDPIEAAR